MTTRMSRRLAALFVSLLTSVGVGVAAAPGTAHAAQYDCLTGQACVWKSYYGIGSPLARYITGMRGGYRFNDAWNNAVSGVWNRTGEALLLFDAKNCQYAGQGAGPYLVIQPGQHIFDLGAVRDGLPAGQTWDNHAGSMASAATQDNAC